VNLNQRFGPYPYWTTIPGDVLDTTFLSNLGKFDIVYSWGVLHHTGDMWNALGNVSSLVKPGGALFISIYNDQGWISRIWKVIKRVYVCCPKIIQFLMAVTWFTVVIFVRISSGLWYKKSPLVWFKGSGRGMNLWYDTVDWVGGYPYETASLETLKSFLEKKCFFISKILANRGSGCNQLVALNKKHGS
jgi:2-polyprenyl-6-hydroxyphenyl methylase/3-demethylubiquinone-9 3-methyltransferase